tara:strand:- start:662 stop:1213 length:552 start_codon:yes stop_codon:yes gene_type:complete
MAKRSKVYDLPPDLRDQLNERLVSTGFQDYAGLADWLSERGFKVSRSSVQRYGSELQEEFEEAMGNVRKTTEMAKAMADAVSDDEGNLIDATARIVQEQLLRVSLALRKAEHEPEDSASHLAKVAKALTNLGRISIAQKKHAKEVRQEVAREAADRATEVAKRGGLSAEMVNDLRRELLGIAK